MKKNKPTRELFYSSRGNTLLIMVVAVILCFTGILQAHANDEPQQKKISGVVIDAKGLPMPGVNVVASGTTQGTMTDVEGKYSIEVPPESKSLTFTFVGMVNQKIVIGTQNLINVTMAESAIGLDEVVVIGYGTQKKVSLTSAVSSIKGEVLTERTVSNVQQALQGEISGLTVLDQGASPGNANMVLRVRGITTLSNNDPLIIVDGIEQRINDINPRDIETVTVLKDASSTAIYGSRASNGVVLITTTRAKESKLSVSYNGYYALQQSVNRPVHMGLEDYMRLQNVAWTNSTGTPIIY